MIECCKNCKYSKRESGISKPIYSCSLKSHRGDGYYTTSGIVLTKKAHTEIVDKNYKCDMYSKR